MPEGLARRVDIKYQKGGQVPEGWTKCQDMKGLEGWIVPEGWKCQKGGY